MEKITLYDVLNYQCCKNAQLRKCFKNAFFNQTFLLTYLNNLNVLKFKA